MSDPQRKSRVPHRSQRRPVLLKGVAADWPAVSRWTPAYLAELAGDREVEVVIGERETKNAVYEKRRLADVFLAHVGEGADEAAEPVYLKEFDLLAEMPQLRDDVDFERVERRRHACEHSAWISNRGARTGYHYDFMDNVLTQLRGRKRVVVISPRFDDEMYPSDRFDFYAKLSTVDGFDPDLERFPRFAEARAAEITFDLEPGDGLYIPNGWWHRAESLTPSISMAGFMMGVPDAVRLLPEHIKLGLHQLGLYKKGDCACHRQGSAAN